MGSHKINSRLPLFYDRIVSLNKKEHRNISIKPIKNYDYATKTNSVYISAIEFHQAARDYAIVFAKDDKIFPVVLLGLDNDNIFVDDNGQWCLGYVPAYIRRYPFILAVDPNNQNDFTVCFDQNYTGFNTADEGNRLFDDDGNENKYLQQIIEFLKQYQSHIKLTTAFCDQLEELNLLDPMQANINLNSGEVYTLRGFYCINKNRLKELSDKEIIKLVKDEYMEFIYLHLASLTNVGRLYDQKLATMSVPQEKYH